MSAALEVVESMCIVTREWREKRVAPLPSSTTNTHTPPTRPSPHSMRERLGRCRHRHRPSLSSLSSLSGGGPEQEKKHQRRRRRRRRRCCWRRRRRRWKRRRRAAVVLVRGGVAALLLLLLAHAVADDEHKRGEAEESRASSSSVPNEIRRTDAPISYPQRRRRR